MLDKSKLKIIIPIALIAILWILLVVPFLTTNDTFISLNPLVQYILVNVAFLGLSVSFMASTSKSDKTLKTSIMNGIIIFFIFSFVFDLVAPPYALDTQGNLTMENPNILAGGTPDRLWAYILDGLFPVLKAINIPILNISLIYVVMYIGIPLLTLLVAALILTKAKFKKAIKGGQNVA